MCIEGCFVWKVSKVYLVVSGFSEAGRPVSLFGIVAFIIFEAVFAWLFIANIMYITTMQNIVNPDGHFYQAIIFYRRILFHVLF